MLDAGSWQLCSSAVDEQMHVGLCCCNCRNHALLPKAAILQQLSGMLVVVLLHFHLSTTSVVDRCNVIL